MVDEYNIASHRIASQQQPTTVTAAAATSRLRLEFKVRLYPIFSSFFSFCIFISRGCAVAMLRCPCRPLRDWWMAFVWPLGSLFQLIHHAHFTETFLSLTKLFFFVFFLIFFVFNLKLKRFKGFDTLRLAPHQTRPFRATCELFVLFLIFSSLLGWWRVVVLLLLVLAHNESLDLSLSLSLSLTHTQSKNNKLIIQKTVNS